MNELPIEKFGSTHLEFRYFPSKTGKTLIWNVCNKDEGLMIGRVSWHGPWRKYCFFPIPDCVWSSDCLEDLATFISLKNAERKNEGL